MSLSPPIFKFGQEIKSWWEDCQRRVDDFLSVASVGELGDTTCTGESGGREI
jgi:hypothetical protein